MRRIVELIDSLPYSDLIAVQDGGIAEAARLAAAAHDAAYAEWREAGQPYTANDTDGEHPHMRLRTAEIRHRRIARLAAAAAEADAEAVEAAIKASLEERRDLWRRYPPYKRAE